MKKFSAGTLAVLCLLALPGAAAAVPSAGAAVQRFEIFRATSPIQVDGVLDEAAWQTAVAIPVDHPWSPNDTEPAPVATTALVTYDDERLYIAFRAADPDPAAIRAHYADRDGPTDDDTVGFMIDPFHDGRRAFQFRINPLGVQMDAVNSDVEASEDFSWDAIWDSAGKITAEGYVVEVALPFRQLRFPAASGVQTWGFMAMRDWPRSLRHRMRSFVTDQNRSCLVCQLQELAGFERLETGRNLEITPTLTGQMSEERQGYPDGRFESSGENLEPSRAATASPWGASAATPPPCLTGTTTATGPGTPRPASSPRGCGQTAASSTASVCAAAAPVPRGVSAGPPAAGIPISTPRSAPTASGRPMALSTSGEPTWC